ncbi:MAG: hypothetical protein ACR2QF_16035, partial [Geminicoccaceae bacterium]
MISPFIKTMSRSSATHAGLAMALVCSLGATETSAKALGFAKTPGIAETSGFEEQSNKLVIALEPITGRQLSDYVVIAQFAGDDDEDDEEDFDDDFSDDFDDDFDEGFEEGFEEGFAEGFDEGFDEGFGDDYADGYTEDDGGGYSDSQALSYEERLNRVTGRELQVM